MKRIVFLMLIISSLLAASVLTACGKPGNEEGGGLPAPFGLTAAGNSPDSITLNWTAVSGAAKYRIYTSVTPEGVYSYVAETEYNTYTVSGLVPDSVFYYKVTSVDINGIEGPRSTYAPGRTATLPQYTVAFAPNGAAAGTPPETRSVSSGTVIYLPDRGDMSKGTDAFAGWRQGGGTLYPALAAFTVTENTVFYAQWFDINTPQYTITFGSNGATSGSPPPPQTVYSGVNIALPDQGTLAYTDRMFGGWNTQAGGGGANYPTGAAYLVTGSVMLYAQWQEVRYDIGSIGPAGGLIFYDKGNKSDGWRFLEAASRDAKSEVWGSWLHGTKSDIGAGKQNTQTIINYMMETGNNCPAAQVCRQYSQGGYNDWFLPSKSELNLLYWNLKQMELGDFGNGWYWSSTCGSGGAVVIYYTWVQKFSTGEQDNVRNLSTIYSVRPIRQF